MGREYLIRQEDVYRCATDAYAYAVEQNSPFVGFREQLYTSYLRTTGYANRVARGDESYLRCVSGEYTVSVRCVSGGNTSRRRLKSTVNLYRLVPGA